MSRIPSRFTLFGETWTVRWAKPDNGWVAQTHAVSTTGTREITIHPTHRQHRNDPVQRWRSFAHELVHALQLEMRIHRQEKGWARDPITHDQIEMLEIPLGAFLAENLSLCCAHCSRRPKSSSRRR